MNTYRVLGQQLPTATVLTDLYTVPGATEAVISTIMVANQDDSNDDVFRIAIAIAGAGDSPEQYLAFNVSLPPGTAIDFTIGATLAATDVVRVWSANGTSSFNIFGEELS